MPRIEDYALIGDLQTARSSAATARSTGRASRASTPAPASRRCSVRRITAAGSSRHATDAWEGERQVPTAHARPRDGVGDRHRRRARHRLHAAARESARHRAHRRRAWAATSTMCSELVIRFDYGATIPWVRRMADGRIAVAGPDALCFRTPVEHRGENMRTLGEFTVRRGRARPLRPHLVPVERAAAASDRRGARARPRPTSYWDDWAARCGTTASGTRTCSARSIVLKALTYAPTGGIVAAATTSLPEKIGGVRNWDYRYCWLRDATLTLLRLPQRGLSRGGARLAASGCCARSRAIPSALQIMYGVGGERRLTELELDWLPGYEGSKPVRVGNAASEQFQLDVYGEVLDALHQARVQQAARRRSDAWALQRRLLELPRGRLEGARRGHLGGPRPAPALHALEGDGLGRVRPRRPGRRALRPATGRSTGGARLRAEIHEEVCEQGFDAELNSFTQSYGSKRARREPADDPARRLPARPTTRAWSGTVARDRARARARRLRLPLRARRGQRASTGCRPAKARSSRARSGSPTTSRSQGRLDEAQELFERLLALRNDVGLLAEEWDRERAASSATSRRRSRTSRSSTRRSI